MSILPYPSKQSVEVDVRRSCDLVEAPVRKAVRKIEGVFRSSWSAQIADYSYFHRHWMGDIIVLIGSSTAGKTSIIKSLRQIEPDRIEEGIDLRCDANALHFYRNECPNEVAVLEKVMDPLYIPKAVRCKELVWKTEVLDSEKNEIEAALQQMKSRMDARTEEEIQTYFPNPEMPMWDAALELAQRGKRVIFDTFRPGGFIEHMDLRDFDGPCRVVLVYCPFHILSYRMEERNQQAVKSGELSNQRVGAYPFIQFSDYFTQRKEGQRALETITREQAIKAFDSHFDKEIPFLRNEGHTDEEILLGKKRNRQILLDQLGFKESLDRVEIAPRDPHLYHRILNTSKLKPEESAKILHAEVVESIKIFYP